MQRPPVKQFVVYALILTLVGSLFSLGLPVSLPSYASHENITVNVSGDVTDVHDPGDSVVIEGTIDDVQEGEDVTIRVLDPDDFEEADEDVTPNESSGYFALEFDIPSNADGGIWTIETTYDGEEVYSYFVVEFNEDDIDVIEVDLDQTDGIYEADDEVIIAGTVPEFDDTEEFVEIIVRDPANGEIVDENQVELGDGSLDEDEFEFSFDLENDAVHGRYAVIVTYDGPGDQRGAAAFEIEDADEGVEEEEDLSEDAVTEDSDGDLSAEIDNDVYVQGGTVAITGTIEDYDPDDNEELGISIRDPDDTEIEADDDVHVDEDGTDGVFEFDYDIRDDADEGLYTIDITYDNDEVELAFVVEEGDGGGSDELTVELDESSYLAGETMTVSGTVDDVADPDEGEVLSVFLYMPEGQVILAAGSSKYVEPSSDGEYSATITIPSDLEEGEGYRVKVSYLEETVEATFEISGVSDTPNDEITVEADSDEYEIGQTVKISGEVPEAMIVEGQKAFLRVDKPDGNPCRLDTIDIPSSGSYEYELVLGGECGVAGEYEITVTYSQEEAEASFELIGPSASEYDLIVEDEAYPIEYELSEGELKGMFVRTFDKKLVISIEAEEDGQITVVLPREVIDAIEEGQDIEYAVVSTDLESGAGDIIDVEETENTDETRTLVIDYQAGTDLIEITGTQVIPEFGQIAAIVLALSIVGIIVATARYGNKFSIFRQ